MTVVNRTPLAAAWGTASSLPDVTPVRALGETGEIDGASLEESDVLALYEMMCLTRGLDEEAIALQRQGQLAVYPSGRGQEAVQVGTAYALDRDQDWVFPSYRELGAALVWGVDPASLLHVFRGTWFSDHDVRRLRFGLQTIPVATQLLHATGVAMGIGLAGDAGVVLTYIGDGATSEGDFHEALNFAAVRRAPVVFVIQNNQYAISVPLRVQTAAERLSYRGIGYGMPAVVVDGNDVVACHEVTRQAVALARGGEGPSLIEAITYRMEGHTTADDPTRYRGSSEVHRWAGQDPIVRLERYLMHQALLTDELADRVRGRVAAARTLLRQQVFDAPTPDPSELFDHVYVDSRGHFDGQQTRLQSELRRLEHG